MNKQEKEVLAAQLNDEKNVLNLLKSVYNKAALDTAGKIAELSTRGDMENLQSIVYQKQYQEALLNQINATLDQLQSDSFLGISDYLEKSYNSGYIGAMYNISSQGIPIIQPIDQKKVVRALQTDSKLSTNLYNRLGEDVGKLKKSIRAEISRGIVEGKSYNEIAEKIAKGMNSPFNKAKNNSMRIARTEGHRIQLESQMDALQTAKKAGADIVKQWDATLDSRTRESHQLVDGEIRELDEKFSNGLMMPGDPMGAASEVINCRCSLLQRARWALDDNELQTLKDRAEFFGLDKTKNFEEYKKKYLSNSQIADIKFKYEKPISKLNTELKVVGESFSKLPTKVQKELSNVNFSMGSNGSGCDTKKGIIYVAQGAEKQDVDHEIGHMIETRMMSKESVKAYKDYLVEGLTSVDIEYETYYNNAQEEYKILIVKGERFVSEYQGRIYASSIEEALNPDGSINTDLMLETISEPFRLYQNDKDKLNGQDMIIKMIEGAMV